MNDNHQFGALDLITILSFGIGYLNLLENRQQSAHNDVSYANDKQAQYLLEELERKFDSQNKMLDKILEVIKDEAADREEQGNTAG